MAELKKLGRYELRRELGEGAMGVVYEGFDPSLDRRVAVKTIRKNDVIDEETERAYSQRFAREARAVGRLSHPNVVQVYDFGEEGEVAYIVMEFIEGRELRAFFDAGERFEPAEAVRIMAELLDALGYAHDAGVIHRDVKPANVILDRQRRVKLADFGVARIQDGTDLSRAGTMVGTPAFMSPEQITGGRIDRRTDLFSAGVVLYQLLTGEQPYKGDGAWTVAKAILQEEPPRPSTIAEQVPAAFDQIINRALAKKAEHRFANAKDFAAALRGALADSAPGSAASATDAEVEFWRSIQASSDPAEFRVYLKQFPNGVYAELAKIKLAKLPAAPERALDVADEVARLTEKEAEYREREARLDAEEKALAEADALREAETQARAAAAEKARLEAVEKEKRAAAAELARREEEYRKREAEAAARAEAEARARREAEARAKQEAAAAAAKARAEAEAQARKDAESLARAKLEAEELARREAAERAKRDLEAARREAEAAKREAELKRRLAEAPRAKLPVTAIAVTLAIIAAAGSGLWYRFHVSEQSRVEELTSALDAATKANEALGAARRQAETLRQQVASARLAEEDARARGDQSKLKELQEQTRLAEAEQRKQAEVVKQREAEAQKQADALKVADAKKKGGESKAALERAAAEKAAAEKAQAEADAKAALEEEALAKREAAEAAEREKARIAARTPLAAVRQLAIPEPAASKSCKNPATAFRFSDGTAGCLDEYPLLSRLVLQATNAARAKNPFVMAATLELERCPVRVFYGMGEGESGSYASSRCLQSFSTGVFSSETGCVCEVVFDSREATDKQYFLGKVRAMEAACRHERNRGSEFCSSLPVVARAAPGPQPATGVAAKTCSSHALAFKFADGSSGCLDDYPVLRELVRMQASGTNRSPIAMAISADLGRCPLRAYYYWNDPLRAENARSSCEQSFRKESFERGNISDCSCELLIDSGRPVEKQAFAAAIAAIESACGRERDQLHAICRSLHPDKPPPSLAAGVLEDLMRRNPKARLLKLDPMAGTVPTGQVVFVDDGSCKAGEIKRIVGGGGGRQRTTDCVKIAE